jgi:GNAT superfamily N-acetyltransferase
MPDLAKLWFRSAGAGDAEAIAALHAESWRRHYRGAYSDVFLDGDVFNDRARVWTERLRTDDNASYTVVGEDDAGIAGFAHVIFGADPEWGALLDNLHVKPQHKRRGIGSELFGLIALPVIDRNTPLYLWVLERNTNARAFYEARRGVRVERAPVSAPGGVASRIVGSPRKLRYAWSDPSVLRADRLATNTASRSTELPTRSSFDPSGGGAPV